MTYYFNFFIESVRHPSKIYKTIKNIFRSGRVQTYIVSYPKTGRTWLRVLLGKTLVLHTGNNEEQVLDTFMLSESTGIPPVLFSHGGLFGLVPSARFDALSFKTNRYKNRRVAFLIRDIRDTLVSSYFEDSKRRKVFSGSISDFVRDPQFGIRKIICFYSLWFENQSVPDAFLLVRYEELKARPHEITRDILSFIGASAVTDDTIKQAVEYASFDNMKKMESKGEFKDVMLKPGADKRGESFKVRRGKIGGFVDYLSEEDIQYIDEQVKKLGNTNCDWYYGTK